MLFPKGNPEWAPAPSSPLLSELEPFFKSGHRRHRHSTRGSKVRSFLALAFLGNRTLRHGGDPTQAIRKAHE
jgi:hypothetical protein